MGFGLVSGCLGDPVGALFLIEACSAIFDVYVSRRSEKLLLLFVIAPQKIRYG